MSYSGTMGKCVICYLLIIQLSLLFAYDSGAVIENIISGERKIHNIEVKFNRYEKIADSDTGFSKISSGTWRYSQGRQYIAEHYTFADTFPSLHSCSFDGEKQYVYIAREDIDDNGSASLNVLDPELFKISGALSVLMGDSIDPFTPKTFGEILRDTKDVSVNAVDEEVEGHQCVVVEASGVFVEPEHEMIKYDVKAWLDPARDYRPLRIDYFRKIGNGDRALEMRIDDIELNRFNGVWVPVSGMKNTYSIKPKLPDGFDINNFVASHKGVTTEQLQLLISEQAMNESVLRSQRRWEVDPASVRMNHEFDINDFRIDFPDGAIMWDAFTQMGYVIGEVPKDALSSLDDSIEKSSKPIVDTEISDSGGSSVSPVEAAHSDQNIDAERHPHNYVIACSILLLVVLAAISIYVARKRHAK